MKKLLTIFAGIFFFLSILQIAWGLQRHLKGGLIDFTVYYNYARIFLSGRSPYGPEYTAGIPFNYPPSSFLLFAPISFLPKQTAQLVFTATSLLFFVIITNHLIKLFIKSKPTRLLLLILLMQNFPTKFTLVTGQVNLIVLSVLTISFATDKNNKETLSGIFWGIASMLKLTPLSLGLYFIIRKRYKALIVGLSLFILGNAVILTVSPQSIYYFRHHLPVLLASTGLTTTLYDQSIRAFLARIGFFQASIVSNIFTTVIILFSTWKYLAAKLAKSVFFIHLTDLTYFSVILAATTIGNSFAWQHHFVFLFPGFISESVYLLRGFNITEGVKNKKIRGFLLLVSAILVGYHIPDISHPPTTNPFFIYHTLMGAFILIGLLITQPSLLKARS